jgi:uncharacterized protein (TIGR03437 family)
MLRPKHKPPRMTRRNLLIRCGMGILALPFLSRRRRFSAKAQAILSCVTGGSCATAAANGASIPSWTTPTYGATATTSSGQLAYVPEGMVFVPAGSYVMGAANSPVYTVSLSGSVTSGTGDNRHTVTLSDFCISKYLITNAQYKVFCDEMGSSYRPSYWNNSAFDATAKANHPVLYVGYNNAAAYCAWVARKTGWTVALPSEAQWERAARGQTATGAEYVYPWGNTTTATDYKDRLNFNGTLAEANGTPVTVNGNSYPNWPFVITASGGSLNVSNFKAIAHDYDDTTTADIDESSSAVQAIWSAIANAGGYTTPVGAYPASPAGCHDMAGNAFEWTRDYFTNSYYITLAKTTSDPVVDSTSVLSTADELSGSDGTITNSSGQPTIIVRGGSWYANESSCLTHHRTETRAAGQGGYNSVGFRITAAPVLGSASAPVISQAGVVNAAGGEAGVSPGSWISIYGSNFAGAARTMANSDLVNGAMPTSLGGVSVRIDGKAAFVYYVSPTQINVIVPDDATAGNVAVTVTNASGTSSPVTVALQPVLPGLFVSSGYAVGVRVGDGAAVAGMAVKAGDVLELYGTGFGPTSPAVASGAVFSGAYQAANPVTVTIGGIAAPVSWAGLIGAGLYQINVTVPSGLAGGDYPIIATVSGVSSQSSALLKVQAS